MAEEMNRWGGGGVPCIVCTQETVTPAFVGRLRCCKARVGLCQACKPDIKRAGFSSPRDAVEKWGVLHSKGCLETVITKYVDGANELFNLLGKTVEEFQEVNDLSPHAVETTLIMLCRDFCSVAGLPVEVFAANFLSVFEDQPSVEFEEEDSAELN